MIGARIRALRINRKLTLKEMSERSGLSIGFLSQLERGISSVAIDSLAVLADIFGVALTSFFQPPQQPQDEGGVTRGYDLHSDPISPHIIQYVLSQNVSAYTMLSRLFLLQPMTDAAREEIEMYSHKGEEFAYVLEGIVTVYVDGETYTLYPGDSIQIRSERPHNWVNLTGMPARLLSVNVPNPFRLAGSSE